MTSLCTGRKIDRNNDFHSFNIDADIETGTLTIIDLNIKQFFRLSLAALDVLNLSKAEHVCHMCVRWLLGG